MSDSRLTTLDLPIAKSPSSSTQSGWEQIFHGDFYARETAYTSPVDSVTNDSGNNKDTSNPLHGWVHMSSFACDARGKHLPYKSYMLYGMITEAGGLKLEWFPGGQPPISGGGNIKIAAPIAQFKTDTGTDAGGNTFDTTTSNQIAAGDQFPPMQLMLATKEQAEEHMLIGDKLNKSCGPKFLGLKYDIDTVVITTGTEFVEEFGPDLGEEYIMTNAYPTIGNVFGYFGCIQNNMLYIVGLKLVDSSLDDGGVVTGVLDLKYRVTGIPPLLASTNPITPTTNRATAFSLFYNNYMLESEEMEIEKTDNIVNTVALFRDYSVDGTSTSVLQPMAKLENGNIEQIFNGDIHKEITLVSRWGGMYNKANNRFDVDQAGWNLKLGGYLNEETEHTVRPDPELYPDVEDYPANNFMNDVGRTYGTCGSIGISYTPLPITDTMGPIGIKEVPGYLCFWNDVIAVSACAGTLRVEITNWAYNPKTNTVSASSLDRPCGQSRYDIAPSGFCATMWAGEPRQFPADIVTTKEDIVG